MKKLMTKIRECIAGLFAGAKGELIAANIGEGTHEGSVTRTADEAFSVLYLLAKIGTAATNIGLCGVSDIPLGIVPDKPAAGEGCSVNLLGARCDTQLVVASAAISAGDFVVAAASGKVRTLPTAGGTYYIIGRALNAASADGDLVEIDPCLPTQRVV